MWWFLLASFCVLALVPVEGQLKTPKGKKPARVLAERTLPTGEKEITVAIEDSFILKGQRVAYVEEYSCVKTSKTASGIKQHMSRCIPFVTFAEIDQKEMSEDYDVSEPGNSDKDKDIFGENYYRRQYYKETKKSAALQRQLQIAKENLEKCDFDLQT